MTPILCCGFECGTSTATHAQLVAAASFNTTTVADSGLRSLRCNPSSATGSVNIGAAIGGTLFVGRFYVQISSNPSADTVICGVRSSTNGEWTGAVFNTSDSKVYAGTQTTSGTTITKGATGVSLTAGFHWIDVKANLVANPWLIDVQVDSVALGQASRALAADTLDRMFCGFGQTTLSADVYYDHVIASTTSGDYPIGAGKVLGFVPNADGTHTFTTTIGVRGTTGAPTGGGNIAGSTDSYQWLNARPIGGGATDNTRLWNQQTNGSTLYGEVQFEDTTEVNPPRAVEALIIRRDAGTGTGDSTFKLNDNGTESTIFATGAVAGVASDEFHTKQFATAPSTGGAWTLALFNGLRFRFGYSADANPDHYCRGVMIEAEFPTSLDASAFGIPEGPSGQRQMQQLLSQ